jgi:hypothetical protein
VAGRLGLALGVSGQPPRHMTVGQGLPPCETAVVFFVFLLNGNNIISIKNKSLTKLQ